jgi:hypothetical protein
MTMNWTHGLRPRVARRLRGNWTQEVLKREVWRIVLSRFRAHE